MSHAWAGVCRTLFLKGAEKGRKTQVKRPERLLGALFWSSSSRRIAARRAGPLRAREPPGRPSPRASTCGVTARGVPPAYGFRLQSLPMAVKMPTISEVEHLTMIPTSLGGGAQGHGGTCHTPCRDQHHRHHPPDPSQEGDIAVGR